MRGRNNRAIFMLVLSWLILISILLSGCQLIQAVFQNPLYTYENGAVLVKGNNKPIQLANNPDAINVSYAELLEFIRQDYVDQIPYIDRDCDCGLPPFVCSDYAEAIHNNAEAAGIRAAFVTITFQDREIGHAINAFETIDMGLVYIDCTGESMYSELADSVNVNNISWDKVAYVEIGKQYGVVALDQALSPEYEFYLQYTKELGRFQLYLDSYNTEVQRYNEEISGKVYRVSTLEFAGIQAWKAELEKREKELEQMKQEIGDVHFKPMGIVKNVGIYW